MHKYLVEPSKTNGNEYCVYKYDKIHKGMRTHIEVTIVKESRELKFTGSLLECYTFIKLSEGNYFNLE